MFCKYCGKEIDNGTKFCPYCGKMQDDSPVNDLIVNQSVIHPNNIADKSSIDKTSALYKTIKILLYIGIATSFLTFAVSGLCIMYVSFKLIFLSFIIMLGFFINGVGIKKLGVAKSGSDLIVIAIFLIILNLICGNIFGLIAGCLMLALKHKEK